MIRCHGSDPSSYANLAYCRGLHFVASQPRAVFLSWSMFDSIHVMSFINLADTASIEYKRQHVHINQLDDPLKTSHTDNVTMFLVQGEFWAATISKTSTFEVPKFFTFCFPLVPMGARLPRRDTAALRSPHRLRFSRWAASRGPGGGGCSRPPRPWPWTKDFGRESLLRQWNLYVRKWMKCWWFNFSVDFCFHFCFHWGFYFGSILERPLQSKIDQTFPAQFNGPWHPGFSQPHSVKWPCGSG